AAGGTAAGCGEQSQRAEAEQLPTRESAFGASPIELALEVVDLGLHTAGRQDPDGIRWVAHDSSFDDAERSGSMSPSSSGPASSTTPSMKFMSPMKSATNGVRGRS